MICSRPSPSACPPGTFADLETAARMPRLIFAAPSTSLALTIGVALGSGAGDVGRLRESHLGGIDRSKVGNDIFESVRGVWKVRIYLEQLAVSGWLNSRQSTASLQTSAEASWWVRELSVRCSALIPTKTSQPRPTTTIPLPRMAKTRLPP